MKSQKEEKIVPKPVFPETTRIPTTAKPIPTTFKPIPTTVEPIPTTVEPIPPMVTPMTESTTPIPPIQAVASTPILLMDSESSIVSFDLRKQ